VVREFINAGPLSTEDRPPAPPAVEEEGDEWKPQMDVFTAEARRAQRTPRNVPLGCPMILSFMILSFMILSFMILSFMILSFMILSFMILSGFCPG
jgi:hypothetical protein